jgi:hypothetical protein
VSAPERASTRETSPMNDRVIPMKEQILRQLVSVTAELA